MVKKIEEHLLKECMLILHDKNDMLMHFIFKFLQ